MLEVCMNPLLPLSWFLFLLSWYFCNVLTSSFIFSSLSPIYSHRISPSFLFVSLHQPVVSALLAHRKLLFGKGQLVIGSYTLWDEMNTVKPLLIFAIVMKDCKKDGFSFVQFHVTDSRLNIFIHTYACIAHFFLPLPQLFWFPHLVFTGEGAGKWKWRATE